MYSHKRKRKANREEGYKDRKREEEGRKKVKNGKKEKTRINIALLHYVCIRIPCVSTHFITLAPQP
jgi:hypothetical protein